MSCVKRRRASAFARSEEGTVAIVFALVTVVLILVTGIAIDLGRVVHAESKIAASLDAAALAAAKSLRGSNLSDDEVASVARKFFNANVAGSGGDYARIGTVSVSVDRERNAVTLSVDSEVPTVFVQVAGIEKVSLPRSSVAVYDSKDIELSVQLDVTGSMRGRKLSDLKSAFSDMLDIMLPNGGTTNNVRIGVAPFASGVNAGAFARAVSNGRARNGCVYERLDLLDQTSEAPAIGPLAFKVSADLRGAQACPSDATIVPLTSEKELLRRTVNQYSASTSTAGHLGSAWAWYILSPAWQAIWPSTARPAEYDDRKTAKFAILMTDGIYNTLGGVSNGDHGSTARISTQLALDTCEEMRAKGIVVYTIGFEAPSRAKEMLRACASGPSKFFDATNGALLADAFRAIAAEINNLRLSY
jgi:Flp pilus assembly protein TadG